MLLLGVEAEDLHQRRPRSLVLCHVASCLGLRDWVDDVALLSVSVLSCVYGRFLDIVQHIEGVARRLGDCESVVESEPAWDSTEGDYDSPHLVDRQSTLSGTIRDGCDSH